jgi:hypothetical protein
MTAFFALLIVVLVPISFLHAATFTGEIGGLSNPSGISAFSIWLSVDSSFGFSNFNEDGSAIPTGGTLKWDFDVLAIADDPTLGRVFKIGAFDQDGLYLSNRQDLLNGVLFSFDYVGTILGLTDVIQFDPGNGSNLYPSPVALKSFDSATGVAFAPVPIPAAVWLLSGGLAGLMALRRRMS